MQPIDVQREFNRLSQLYREMHDDELENVAATAYDLTDVARECLAYEIKSRHLPIELNLVPPPSEEDLEPLPPSDDGFVPEDDELQVVEWAEDMDHLLHIKRVLDDAHIELFLGDEKIHDPRRLQSGFEGGLRMRVWRAASEQARELLKATIPGFGTNEEPSAAEVLCPKCKSDGVIFDEAETDAANGKAAHLSTYRWRCDDCGYEWEDDGIIRQ